MRLAGGRLEGMKLEGRQLEDRSSKGERQMHDGREFN